MNKVLAYCFSSKHKSLTIVDVTDPVVPFVLGELGNCQQLRDIDEVVIRSIKHG